MGYKTTQQKKNRQKINFLINWSSNEVEAQRLIEII